MNKRKTNFKQSKDVVHLWQSMTKLGRLMLMAITLSAFGNAYGQTVGWPLSSHGSATYSTNQELCTDRCRVTASVAGMNPGELDLTISNLNGALAVGDWLMMIQMEATTTADMGQYTMMEVVTAATSTTVTVKPVITSSYTNTDRSWSFGTTERVQLVKFARYWNLTISGGVVTCPAYSHTTGTGGILAVLVGNDFTMTNGFMSVAGKGFHTHFDAGGGLGVGSLGVPAAPIHIPSGGTPGGLTAAVNNTTFPTYMTLLGNSGPQAYGEPDGHLCNNMPSFPYIVSENGQAGGQADNNKIVPGNTTGSNFYWFSHSNYGNNDLHLGCSGRNGSEGGQGGGGGGFGGKGGDHYAPTPGIGDPGSIGEDGVDGGDAGGSGVGGGILYLRMANSSLSFTDTRSRFYANATRGKNGARGGDGGVGGDGGIGADGTCNGMNLVTPGGWGGFGGGGSAGNGADAGSGGCGGTIWVLKKGGGTHSTFGTFVNNATGGGGKGGTSGYEYEYMSTPNAYNFDPLLGALACNSAGDFTLCNLSAPCIPVICSCYEVMRHIGEDMQGGITTNTPAGGPYEILKAGEETVYWDLVDELSYSEVINSCVTKYTCKMKRASLFQEMMDKIFAQDDLDTWTGTPIDPGFNTAGFPSLYKTSFSMNSHIILEYDPTTGYLTDYDDPIKPHVTEAACAETYGNVVKRPGGGGGGGGGNPTETPPDQVILLRGTPTGTNGGDGGGQSGGAFHEDALQPVPPPPPSEDDRSELMVYTVVDQYSKELTVNLHTPITEIEGTFTLYSLDGKLVKQVKTTDNTINMSNLQSGIYLLNSTKGGEMNSQKIVIP